MRRLLRFALECAFLAALAAFALLLAMHWLPSTRWARARVAAELARALGEPPEDVALDGLSLHWYEPRVELDGLRLGPKGRDLSIEKARAHFRWKPSWPPRAEGLLELEALELEGGKLSVSRAWLSRWNRARAPREPSAAPLPRIALRELAIELVRAGTEPLALGSARAELQPEGAGMRLTGELALAAGLEQARVLHLEGTRAAGGRVELAAWGADLGLQQQRLEQALRLEGLPLRELALRLDLVARLAIGGDQPLAAGLELAVRGASAEWPLPAADAPANAPDSSEAAEPPRRRIEELELRASVRCAALEAEELLATGGWSADGELSARVAGTPVRADFSIGGPADARDWASASIALPDFELSRAQLESLGLWELARSEWEALEPSGHANARIGLRLARWEGNWLDVASARAGLQIAAEVDLGGRAGMRFRGWKESDGLRHGIPLPVEAVEGRLLFVASAQAQRRWRLGLLGLVGQFKDGSATRRAHCHGFLCAPTTGLLPELDLDLDLPEVGLGDTIRQGLRGMPETAWIWDEFSPGAGTASMRWRVQQSPALNGLAATGDLQFEHATARWKDLAIPVYDLTGGLAVRFGLRPALIEAAGQAHHYYRPVGVSFDLDGRLRTGNEGGAKVHVAGAVRGDSASKPVLAPSEVPHQPLRHIEVEVQDLALTGQDMKDLVRMTPALADPMETFAPKGFGHALWRGGRPAPLLEEPYQIEVSVEGVNMQHGGDTGTGAVLRDVRGRVLVDGLRRFPEGQGPPSQSQSVELVLFGNWVGAEFSARASVAAGAPDMEVELLGAGIDPKQPSVQASLSELSGRRDGGLGEGGPSLSGPIDVDLHTSWHPEGGVGADERRPLMYMRGAGMRDGPLALDDITGKVELDADGEGWMSALLNARLASTALELVDVRRQPLAALRSADPERYRALGLAATQRFGDSATVVLADVKPVVVSIDREFLKGFFDEASLEGFLQRFGWSGRMALHELHVAQLNDGLGGGASQWTGVFDLAEMHFDVGLPIELDEAHARLQSLVIENGRVRAWAEIEAGRGRIAGRRFENARMLISYVDGRLSIEDLHSGFLGGTLSSLGDSTAFALDLAEPNHFAVALALQEVEVAGLLKGVFDSGIADQGQCNARLRLAGRFADLPGMQGTGAIELEHTRLWSIPVVRTLFSQLGLDSSAVFRSMRVGFELREGVISMRPIVVTSPLLRLEGKGTLGLDGGLHHDFEVRYALVDKLGPLTRLLYWVQKNLLRVAVRGDMARPAVLLRSNLLSPFRTVPKDVRHLPLPALAPLPDLF